MAYQALQKAIHLQLPSSLLLLPQSPAVPVDAARCLDTQSAVLSRPMKDRGRDRKEEGEVEVEAVVEVEVKGEMGGRGGVGRGSVNESERKKAM